MKAKDLRFSILAHVHRPQPAPCAAQIGYLNLLPHPLARGDQAVDLLDNFPGSLSPPRAPEHAATIGVIHHEVEPLLRAVVGKGIRVPFRFVILTRRHASMA